MFPGTLNQVVERKALDIVYHAIPLTDQLCVVSLGALRHLMLTLINRQIKLSSLCTV